MFDPNTKSCVREDVAPPGTCFDTSTPKPTGTTPTTITTQTITSPLTTSPKTTPTTITTSTTTISHTTTSTTITTTTTMPTTITTTTTPTTTTSTSTTTLKTTTTSIPPTITPLAVCYIKVIDATTNKLLTNIDYIYTVDGGPNVIDSDSTGAFALTIQVNSTLEISVSKNGFYDESMTGLIDEDKFWLIVMIPSVSNPANYIALMELKFAVDLFQLTYPFFYIRMEKIELFCHGQPVNPKIWIFN